jgi:aryl-alcohol dehydrogenase-like predicted oxidoreductase
MEFLDAVKAEGTVGAIGIAGTTAYELGALVRTGCFDVVLTAFNFSLLWREAADTVIREAVERGVTVIAGSPLQGGALAVRQDLDSPHNSWLSPPRREQFRQLYALSDEAGLSLPELAFRFVLSNPAIDVVLTGSRSVAEVDDAVDFEAAGPLDGDVLRALDALAAQLPCRPFEEPALLPFARAYDGPGVLR